MFPIKVKNKLEPVKLLVVSDYDVPLSRELFLSENVSHSCHIEFILGYKTCIFKGISQPLVFVFKKNYILIKME